jgi:3',5'-cyclic AMP phosphodiesterase CpdA
MRLIHLTDPHLSSLEGQGFLQLRGKRRSGYLSWYRNRRHIHLPAILDNLTASIQAEEADQILLTGDLVHIGLESEIAEAAGWLKRLGPPAHVMLIPGNHDNYAGDSLAAMNRHWGDYLPYGEGTVTDYTTGYPVLKEFGNLQIIGMNSSCTTRIFSATGQLGPEQQSKLESVLASGTAEGKFQCLLIHHPPFPKMTRRRKALRDDRQLKKLLTAQPPELVLYGHLHRDREHIDGHTHIYCTASASSAYGASYRVFDIEQTGRGWTCEMRLMCLPEGSAPTADLVITARSSWSVLN